MKYFTLDLNTNIEKEFGHFRWSSQHKMWSFVPRERTTFGPVNLRTIASMLDKLDKEYPHGPDPSDDIYNLAS